jgi:hypothetical protein
MAFGRVGDRTGFFDWAPAQRKRPTIHGRPPAGLIRPATSPALPTPRVAPAGSFGDWGCLWESKKRGFASLLGTLACLLCMASFALGRLRVRAHRALLPGPCGAQECHATLQHPSTLLGRSARCARKANKAKKPHAIKRPGVCSPPPHRTARKSRRVAPSGTVAQARWPDGSGRAAGPTMDGRPFSLGRKPSRKAPSGHRPGRRPLIHAADAASLRGRRSVSPRALPDGSCPKPQSPKAPKPQSPQAPKPQSPKAPKPQSDANGEPTPSCATQQIPA